MNKDFFAQYEQAEHEFRNKIEELSQIKTFVKTKMGPKYAESCEIFNIRGTRYYLLIRKEYWPPGIADFVSIKLSWKYKTKNKKEYKNISLEDILDSELISNVAKEEIVFNLNVFLTLN